MLLLGDVSSTSSLILMEKIDVKDKKKNFFLKRSIFRCFSEPPVSP
jgi:hypothetical protein